MLPDVGVEVVRGVCLLPDEGVEDVREDVCVT